jgi:hypothetical protein
VQLEGFLPAHTIMVIKITATTTPGKPLGENTLLQVNGACEAVLALEDYKKKVVFTRQPDWSLMVLKFACICLNVWYVCRSYTTISQVA